MGSGLIRVKVTLHSYLKDHLPPETDGQTILDLADGTTIADLSRQLELPEAIAVAVNENIERDRQRVIADGDHVRFLRPGVGG